VTKRKEMMKDDESMRRGRERKSRKREDRKGRRQNFVKKGCREDDKRVGRERIAVDRERRSRGK
jgi:hypothetical protein